MRGHTLTMGQELLLNFGDLLAAGKQFTTLADAVTGTSITPPQAGAVDCSFALKRLRTRADDLASSLNQMSQITSEVSMEMTTWDDSIGQRFPTPFALNPGFELPSTPGLPGLPTLPTEPGEAPPAPLGGYVQHPNGPMGDGTLVLPPNLVPLGPPAPGK